MVTIDDQAALCINLDCDYTYEESSAVVTSMTVDGLEVTITGIDIPLETLEVEIGYTDCAVSSASADQIYCTLEYPLFAGTWDPEVTAPNGLLAIDTLITPTTVTLTVDSITPSTGLNPAGGDTIVIVGTNFPSVTAING